VTAVTTAGLFAAASLTPKASWAPAGLVLSGIVVAALFGLGLAAGLSRLASDLTHEHPVWWATAALAALVLGLVSGPAVIATARGAAETSRAQVDALTAARDSAGPQTQRELADRVASALSSTVGQTDPGSAAEALVAAWHPGPVQADAENGASLPQYLLTMLLPLYDAKGRVGGVREGDTVLAEWGASLGEREIDEASAELLELPDGRAMFPGASYKRLDVVLNRQGARVPFLSLVAVDDNGKWWLVGVQLPQ
jgi:hypothetical protein